MHARNRNTGNGYRSNSMVMGGSRVSPENSVRGQAAYRSDYRSFNNAGYGRGQLRQFQRPPQPKQGDVFMEAGRLATEYLVSKGLMPPNVLTGKWKSDSFQSQVGADGMQLPSGGRTPALSRLGGPVTDVGPGRRRYPDEYYSTSSTNVRDRRSGSLKNPSPDRSREFGRSGSLSDRSRASVVADNDNDALSSHQGQQKVSNEGGGASQDHTPESSAKDNGGTAESKLEKRDLTDYAGAKTSSCSIEKDISMVGDVELLQEADVTDPQPEAGEIRDENDYIETEQGQAKDDMTIEEAGTVDSVLNESGCDLVKLSSTAKDSAKTCSVMTFQGLKVDADDMTINADTLQDELPKESGSSVKDMDVGCLPSNDSSILQSDNLELPSKEDELLVSHNNSHHISNASVSEVDKSSSGERVTNEELPECVIVNVSKQGKKRAMDEESTKEENKRLRESVASQDFQSEGCLLLSDSLEKQPTREESIVLEDGGVLLPSDEERLLDISLFPKDDTESCVDYTEEKQLFPASFKTCDLNLMEVSDMTENHEKKNILLFPSATERGKQPIPVNIDLSMSNNSRVSNNFGECSIADKDIEVIDLENEPDQEEKGLNNSEKRSENVFTCLDGYTNNTQNGNDISDVQDGYGLMISELLGNDIPSCSSVPTDLNSLNSDIGLHSSENMLGDDDIYISLEEIPISFLRVWEQPSQDYGKPF